MASSASSVFHRCVGEPPLVLLRCSVQRGDHSSSTVAFEVQARELTLKLRSAFGYVSSAYQQAAAATVSQHGHSTAHSSSTTRSNVLIMVSVSTYTGFAEIGLPPKKPGVYDADVVDCAAFTTSTLVRLGALLQHAGLQITGLTTSSDAVRAAFTTPPPAEEVESASRNPFAGIDSKYFAGIRTEPDSIVTMLLWHLLNAADTCAEATAAYGRAGRSGIETAVLDAWGHVRSEPMYQLVGSGLPSPLRRTFYTASLKEDVRAVVKAAQFGFQASPCLKIKLNEDATLGKEILSALARAMAPTVTEHGGSAFQWSVDANSSWTPELAMTFLPLMADYPAWVFQNPGSPSRGAAETKTEDTSSKPRAPVFLMLEQPFPAHLQDSEFAAWRDVRAAYNKAGIMVFADETVCTAADVRRLAEAGIVDGVNIKMEKAGGYRGAVAALCAAQEAGLRCWLGCMVGTALNGTATAQLLGMAEWSDLDGPLLVDKECVGFDGGMVWTTGETAERGFIELPNAPGLGMTPAHGLHAHMCRGGEPY